MSAMIAQQPKPWRGASGFIGSHLVRRLTGSHDEVLARSRTAHFGMLTERIADRLELDDAFDQPWML
jgi:uncharacterized protein YbjT (DUF2867 family)